MNRLTKKLLEEARKMERAWVATNPNGDREWYLREIASLKGVEYAGLAKKLGKRKKNLHFLRIRR